MKLYDLLIIGGGAAGFFTAINTQNQIPDYKIGIIEKQSKFLQKVKVSGGGRCNVTNGITDPILLSKNYPRGEAFLAEAFQTFNTTHTQAWFKERGVALKTEKDGRVFPVSDSSQTIIDCFLKEAKKVDLMTSTRVESFEKTDGMWWVTLNSGEVLKTKNLMIASGSDKRIWDAIDQLQIKVAPQVPSLFTFNITDPELHALQGVSFTNAKVQVMGKPFQQTGPLLITHWGLSGPAILKLSAWGAYALQEKEYKFKIQVNWIPDIPSKQIEKELKELFQANPKKNIRSLNAFGLTQRFWLYICIKSGISEFQKGAESGKKQVAALVQNLSACVFEVNGKSTFKEEFVTAGGVELDQIDSKGFYYKMDDTLFFGGEVLNIDAITGGFNFQAAWTAGWCISKYLFQNKQ